MLHVYVLNAQRKPIYDRELPRERLLEFIDKQFALGFTVVAAPSLL